MIWIIVLYVLIMISGALAIMGRRLGDQWRHSRTGLRSADLIHYGGIGVLVFTLMQAVLTISRSSKTSSENRILSERNVKLTEELSQALGRHEIYPWFWFFRGSYSKVGTHEMLQSTIPLVIYNPGDYPIYEVDVHIRELLETRRWYEDAFARVQKGSEVVTDSAGNLIPPSFLETHLYFPVLQPKIYHQREISAPPPKGKSEYVYEILVSARNGQTLYRYRFVRRPNPAQVPVSFFDFNMAYKIMSVKQRKKGEDTFFINKLVKEYHDELFPVSRSGTIDYGPDIPGYEE